MSVIAQAKSLVEEKPWLHVLIVKVTQGMDDMQKGQDRMRAETFEPGALDPRILSSNAVKAPTEMLSTSKNKIRDLCVSFVFMFCLKTCSPPGNSRDTI